MAVKPKAPLVVVERKQLSWYLRMGLLLGVILVVVFYAGRLEDRYTRSHLTHQRDRLQARVDELEQQVNSAQSLKTQVEQSRVVDDMASSELRQTVKTMQDSVKELEKENAFYRGIMNPNADKTGLNIDAFSVLDFGADNRFRFKLTLTQLRSHEQNIKGRVRVSLNGAENGQPKAYDLFVIAGLKDPAQGFDFRYFQNLEGEVVLPAGFAVRDIRVSAAAEGRNALERVFLWEQSHVGQ